MSSLTAKAFVCHCMDLRIQQTVENLLRSLGIALGEFDRVSVAGGAGNFASLNEHLAVSFRLHNPQEIILTIHEDCGAGATKNDFAEAFRLSHQYTENTRAFFINLDGTWEEIRQMGL